MTHTAADYFCSTLSRDAHEPLYGSAPEKRVWLLLEYDQPWGAKAFPESTLPQAVKAHLDAHLTRIPGSSILMLRQPGQQREGIAFFVAVADETAPRLYAYTLSAYTDLLDLDLEAMIAGDPIFGASLTTEPLYLVCTNGRRDRCCSLYGIDIYRELQNQVGEYAWQCSHLGGHRFAPNLLAFPHGLCYGRFQPQHVATITQAYREGHLLRDYLRGRVCYPAPVQAADYLLRQQHDISSIDALKLVESTAVAPDQWAMKFMVNGEKHNIRLEKFTTDVEIYTSCFDDKTAFVSDYRLI